MQSLNEMNTLNVIDILVVMLANLYRYRMTNNINTFNNNIFSINFQF